MSRLHALACTTVLAGSLLISPLLPAAQNDPDTLNRSIESARTLIEESSLAKRVAASGNAQAAAERERARDLHRQAVEAAQAGDGTRANELLGEAKKSMFQAVQMAGNGGTANTKAKRDYEARAASVRALLDAQDRVATEKSADAGERAVHDDVDALLGEADAKYRAGQYKDGIVLLDEALDKLRVSIEHMRGGETVENRVVFANKSEEFQYYWDKTGSQLEALELASASVAGTGKEKSVQNFTQKMKTARAEARSLADGGDHVSAVTALEGIFKQAPFQLMSVLR